MAQRRRRGLGSSSRPSPRARGAPARRAAGRPHAARARSTRSLGQEEVLGPGQAAAARDRGRPAPLADPLGPARLGQDDARPRDPPHDPRPLRGDERRALGRQGAARGPEGGGGAPARARAAAPSLFIDEIHRYNKAQQDALLSHVESGDVVADRRHHREPVLRGQRGAALALPGGGAEAAGRARSSWQVLRRALADAERGLAALAAPRWTTTRSRSWPRRLGRRRAHRAQRARAGRDHAAPGEDGRRRVDLEAMRRRSRARRCSTTARARSTSTSSARSTSRSATRTPTRASTGWRACWRPARTRSTWRAGWCASPPRTSASPTRRPWCWPWPRSRPCTSSACRRAPSRSPSSSCTWRRRPRATRSTVAYGEAAQDALTTRAEPVPLWIRNAPTGLMKETRLRQGLSLRPRRGGRRGRDGLPARRAARAGATTAHRRAAQEAGRGAERLEAARLVRRAREGASGYALSDRDGREEDPRRGRRPDRARRPRQILAQQGYEVTTAGSGEDALAILLDRSQLRPLHPGREHAGHERLRGLPHASARTRRPRTRR